MKDQIKMYERLNRKCMKEYMENDMKDQKENV